MPISQSAKRAFRASQRRRLANEAVRSRLKRVIKKPGSDLVLVYQTIDKAAKGHLIHWKKAARVKSRLAKLAPKNH